MTKLADLAEEALALALKAGADAASVVAADSRSTEAALRDGQLENVESSESIGIDLVVWSGASKASVSSGSVTSADLAETARRALAMARLAPPDPFSVLAEPGELATHFPDLELNDPTGLSTERLVALARECEDAARAVPGVSKSAGAGASMSRYSFAKRMSNGFAGEGTRSGFSFSVSAIAGEGTGMERDYDYSSAVWFADLDSPHAVGRNAGERAVARLHPRKVKSQAVPVIFDPRVASGILSHLAGAIAGQAIARGTSFLKDGLGAPLFAPGITILDDPLKKRAPASRAFDSDGLPAKRTEVVKDGVLSHVFMDLASARQLGRKATGRGSSNLWMANGTRSPAELMADIGQGLFVTELLGHGANLVTGDYSRGASGFWIENGEIAYPVSEITIAGNLKDMFARLTPANDLKFRGSLNAPTLRLEGMTIAGA